MKIQLALEKIMWALVVCLFIGALPFCYWAATPDELIIISENEETETTSPVVTFEVAPAKQEIKRETKEVAEVVEVEPVEVIAEPLEETSDIEDITTMYEDGYLYLGSFRCSGYCICYECCDKLPSDPAYGITATGTKATQGRTIAVDPNIIPYGTEVLINGNTYIAEDTGGSIYGKRIDICFDSHTEADVFGIQYIDIYVKE